MDKINELEREYSKLSKELKEVSRKASALFNQVNWAEESKVNRVSEEMKNSQREQIKLSKQLSQVQKKLTQAYASLGV